MITRDILKKEGYVHFLDYKNRNLYQKAIRDSKGYKKYFINITESDLDFIRLASIRYDAEVQFTTIEETFNLSIPNVQFHTIQDIERFFDIMWNTLDCLYYDGYEQKDVNKTP